MWQRTGHLGELVCGGWARRKEDHVRTGLAVQEWAQNCPGELQGHRKGTAVHLLLLLKHTFITAAVVLFRLFSRVLQLRFGAVSDLSQIPTAAPTSVCSWERAMFTGNWRDCERLSRSKCYCSGGDSPKGAWRGTRRKQRPGPGLCKPRGAFSITCLKSRLWQGRWRTE